MGSSSERELLKSITAKFLKVSDRTRRRSLVSRNTATNYFFSVIIDRNRASRYILCKKKHLAWNPVSTNLPPLDINWRSFGETNFLRVCYLQIITHKD